MYDPEVTRAPDDEAHFWRMVEDNLEHARHVLFDYVAETREEAVRGEFRTGGPKETSLAPMSVLSFRAVSSEYDQRDYCLELGRATFPVAQRLARARALTPEFAQAWGVLQFCHGYLASHLFDDADTLAQSRAALRSAVARSNLPQRTWIAKLALMGRAEGLKRSEIDERLGAYIASFPRSPTFPAAWFDVLIKKGQLRDTFTEKRFSYLEMEALVDEGIDDPIPPVPGKFP
ncbi:hypothetical protein [Hansschlegelia sp.]|uniref:hypothetical protein n=1 Tax=Hansschlegelia sp. TaxID=2041892 RepID=UPI002B6B3620|nr:hypothetical protein [Hansschlegelia sp.]HVI30170.1 hypothetical protein [Hansschlegelia sp.]